MACQPISKEVPLNNLPYTGVEYVEPHLLPCTVCHRPASQAYQAKMFELEAKFDTVGDDIESGQENGHELLLSELAQL